MTTSRLVVKTKRKKTKSIQAKKWASYKKLWLIYKISKGNGDRDTEIKTALKLVKIAKGLKDGNGVQIPIPRFKIIEEKSHG